RIDVVPASAGGRERSALTRKRQRCVEEPLRAQKLFHLRRMGHGPGLGREPGRQELGLDRRAERLVRDGRRGQAQLAHRAPAGGCSLAGPQCGGNEATVALYAFVALKYRYPLERMQKTVDRHRAYLRELITQGKMIASGPFVPREGGALLLRVEEESEIPLILSKDPYQVEELVDTTIYRWAPNIGAEGLDSLPRLT